MGDPCRSARRENLACRYGRVRATWRVVDIASLASTWPGSDLHDYSSAAFDALPTDSRWRPQAGALSGIALAIVGRSIEANERLVASEELARALEQQPARADCLAALASIALDSGRRSAAGTLTENALQVLRDHQLIDLPTSAYALSVVSENFARMGRSSEARSWVGHARSLTASVAEFAPWLQDETRIRQVNTHLLVGDIATSRRLAGQAQDLTHQRGTESHLSTPQRERIRHAELQLAQSSADGRFGSLPLPPLNCASCHS